MGDSVTVAPVGLYTNLPKLTFGRSAICRRCGQSQLCVRVPFTRTPVSTVCSSESSDERWLSSVSTRGAGMGLRERGKQRSRRRLKEASLRRFLADVVLCAYARAFESAQSQAGLSLETGARLRGSFDRSVGEAHPGRDECGRFGCRGEHDGGAFSQWHGDRGSPEPSADEPLWQGPGGREGARKSAAGDFHSSDERLRKPGRFSDSGVTLGPSRDDEGTFRDRVPGGGSGVLDQQGYPGYGRARNYIPRHSSPNIPRSELLKIEELRFSGAMREGDSSAQVLNLQRALFWLGHLPGLSLTGYFGPETTKALQEFHSSNGFSSPGVWGFHSQQLLWKLLYPETQQRHPDKEITVNFQRERKEKPGHDSRESWRFVKNTSGKAVEDELRACGTLQRGCSESLREFVASISSKLPSRTVTSRSVGVLLLTVAVLSVIVKVVHFCFGRVYGQPIRKRVMSWRNVVDLRRPQKANQSPSSASQGHHKPSEGGQIMRYFQSHLNPKAAEKPEKSGCNLLDCLVLFDGQVLRRDYPRNGKMQRSTRAQLGHKSEQSTKDASDSAREGKALPVLSPEQVDGTGSSTEAKRMSHDFDQFQKLEAGPAREVSPQKFSPVNGEKSSGLTGWNQPTPFSSPDPGWASWLKIIFASLFPRERHPYNRCKARRAVVRTNSSKQTKPPGHGGGSHVRSSKLDKGLSAETETQSWEAETELELKKRVEELHKTVQSVEQTRVAAMRALAEEKMQNLELEVKIRLQKQAAAALEEEVRVLKDAHEALLASLKKCSSSASGRAAAALLYQNWDPSDSGARV